MKKANHILRICAALLLCCSISGATLPVLAASSPVEQALQKADILPKKYAFRVTQIGAEALVQTYARPNAPETDVKIDAVFIARIVTEKLPDIAKVKVQFFKYDASSYQQVIVTVGDIKAFGTGNIAKEKLLQSLEVLRSATNEKVASGSKSRAAINPSPAASADGVFRADGLSFSYPKSWTFVPPKGPTSLGELTIPRTNSWAVVSIRKQDSPSPDAQAVYDEDYTLKNAGAVVRKGPVSVGAHRLTGYQLLTSSFENNERNKPRFQQHVYFGEPGETYSLTLQYAADGTALSADFTRVLNTVTLTRR